MIHWTPFVFDGVTYDLSHLHPFKMSIIQAAVPGKAERQYKIQVFFSLHCFTKSQKGQKNINTDLLIADNRETRIFDFKRYKLSKHLKTIIESIGLKNCSHTGHGNYFIVELVDDEGKSVKYEIYFAISKGTKILNLFVQSAYSKDSEHQGGHKKKKPIKFMILAHNTQVGKKIKVPK